MDSLSEAEREYCKEDKWFGIRSLDNNTKELHTFASDASQVKYLFLWQQFRIDCWIRHKESIPSNVDPRSIDFPQFVQQHASDIHLIDYVWPWPQNIEKTNKEARDLAACLVSWANNQSDKFARYVSEETIKSSELKYRDPSDIKLPPTPTRDKNRQGSIPGSFDPGSTKEEIHDSEEAAYQPRRDEQHEQYPQSNPPSHLQDSARRPDHQGPLRSPPAHLQDSARHPDILQHLEARQHPEDRTSRIFQPRRRQNIPQQQPYLNQPAHPQDSDWQPDPREDPEDRPPRFLSQLRRQDIPQQQPHFNQPAHPQDSDWQLDPREDPDGRPSRVFSQLRSQNTPQRQIYGQPYAFPHRSPPSPPRMSFQARPQILETTEDCGQTTPRRQIYGQPYTPSHRSPLSPPRMTSQARPKILETTEDLLDSLGIDKLSIRDD
ncbi:hypothetical protein AC578_4018 [Pseudocercospora eumusae]|uniref:Uncharacterized protein n=1 Tax=Pseudocercospora eumusae TaxID=321146 RepID=A0A139HE17_9PEZI|nr:hypothetical protein AC578_4018 [Pseudocercospora eumusae]